MGFNGIGAAVMVSVFVVIAIAIFIAVLNDQSNDPGCPNGTYTALNGTTSLTAASNNGRAVTAVATAGALSTKNLVRTDGSQCSATAVLAAAATNANAWAKPNYGPLASSNYTLTLTVLRLVTAIAGLAIIVVIWRAAMVDKG